MFNGGSPLLEDRRGEKAPLSPAAAGPALPLFGPLTDPDPAPDSVGMELDLPNPHASEDGVLEDMTLRYLDPGDSSRAACW